MYPSLLEKGEGLRSNKREFLEVPLKLVNQFEHEIDSGEATAIVSYGNT